MRSICVFCGSSSGYDSQYTVQARLLGETLAKKGIGLVYGGAKVGLMGALADAALRAGGEVTGVLPRFLEAKELAHENLTELIVVDTMHERKTRMNELCDGVIAMPGGFGTLEEFFEMLTWAQLGLHKKPIAILNINGFYDGLMQLAGVMVEQGFLKEAHRDMLLISSDIDDLLRQMEGYVPPAVGKWIAVVPPDPR